MYYLHTISLINNLLHQCSIFVRINEPVLTKVYSLLRCSWFVPNGLFLFQDPILDTTLHLVVMFFKVLLSYSMCQHCIPS